MAYIREYPPGPKVSPGGTKINLGTWMCYNAMNALLVNCIPEEVLVGAGVGKKEKGYNYKIKRFPLCCQ